MVISELTEWYRAAGVPILPGTASEAAAYFGGKRK